MMYNGDEIDHKVSEKILVANTLSWPKGFSIMLRQYVPIQPSQTWKYIQLSHITQGRPTLSTQHPLIEPFLYSAPQCVERFQPTLCI